MQSNSMGLGVMKCSRCKRDETELESVGTTLNIPLGICNVCIKLEACKGGTSAAKVVQVSSVAPRSKKHLEAYRCLEDLVYESDLILGRLRQGDCLEGILETEELLQHLRQFYDFLKKADEIVGHE